MDAGRVCEHKETNTVPGIHFPLAIMFESMYIISHDHMAE